MPELPDVEVIKDILRARVVGQTIVSVGRVGPIVVRNLLPGGVAEVLTARPITSVDRRGKFLLVGLGSGLHLVINFMLAGRLTLCEPGARMGPRTHLELGLSSGQDLRYIDAVQMGKVYLTGDLAGVPAFAEQGPDALDGSVTVDVFRERLRRHPGEIKGALTNQAFLAGIGNAYADEILFAAGIYPFRRRSELSADDVARLHAAMRDVLEEAIARLRVRMGDNLHEEIRDFLKVHGKAGLPCPRCGTPVSQVSANQRITNFCRHCQPGTLIRQTGPQK